MTAKHPERPGIVRLIRAKQSLGSAWNRLDMARERAPGAERDRAVAEALDLVRVCEAALPLAPCRTEGLTDEAGVETRLLACADVVRRATPWPVRHFGALVLAVLLAAWPAMSLVDHLRVELSDKGVVVTTFAGVNMDKVVSKRTEQGLLADYGKSGPLRFRRLTAFSEWWEGFFLVPQDGPYFFDSRSAGGSRLFIDDQLVVDRWENHPWGYVPKVEVTLTSGWHRLRLDYCSHGGQASLWVRWVGGPIEKWEVLGPPHLRKKRPGS